MVNGNSKASKMKQKQQAQIQTQSQLENGTAIAFTTTITNKAMTNTTTAHHHPLSPKEQIASGQCKTNGNDSSVEQKAAAAAEASHLQAQAPHSTQNAKSETHKSPSNNSNNSRGSGKGRNKQNNNRNNQQQQQQQQHHQHQQQQQQNNSNRSSQGQNSQSSAQTNSDNKLAKTSSYRNASGKNSSGNRRSYNRPLPLATFNENLQLPSESCSSPAPGPSTNNSRKANNNSRKSHQRHTSHDTSSSDSTTTSKPNISAGDMLAAALTKPCNKCLKPTSGPLLDDEGKENFPSMSQSMATHNSNPKQYRKSKSYVNSSRYNANASASDSERQKCFSSASSTTSSVVISSNRRHQYQRSQSDRRDSFDRHFAERNKNFVPIKAPIRPILSSSNIAFVIVDAEKMVIVERLRKGRIAYPIMQCGTLDAPDSSYHKERSDRMDVYQIDDGFHSDGGTETPPPSPSSGSSIASTSDHGSLESVDTGGTQRLAVLSFEQVRKLHHVMDEKVAIHGRGNFPTLEVKLKDLVNNVRRNLEKDVADGGAGVIVKDIRLNGGAASHVLASEDQPYNDLDLIYAIELSSPRHFDRVKSAVIASLLDLLPEGVSKRRIMQCALREAYVGKMVKVNNNNDGDRWSLISLGNSPGHKNVELKFVDTMRRQFEFSVDSFQIVLDSLLLFYDCAALPISENFYPTVVGESVYGDFQEALYHLQNKMISTRQPEEIRGGGLLKYCNLLVRKYKPVDSQRIKTLERYMCSRFFIDFPDITVQTVKLEAYLRNHFWGVDEEPLQYQYLMHLREVVENSTVCLMGHERRQTLLLIQTLADQVLYKEQQKQLQGQQQYQQQQHQQQQQQQQQQQHHHQHKQHQQQPHTVQAATMTLVAAAPSQSQHHHHQPHQHQQHQLTSAAQQQQTTTIYVQQVSQTPPQTVATTATICCAMPAAAAATAVATVDHTQQQQQQAQQQQQQQPQATQPTALAQAVPQAIQIQAAPGGLIYANGVYYAPICTCNSWLST